MRCCQPKEKKKCCRVAQTGPWKDLPAALGDNTKKHSLEEVAVPCIKQKECGVVVTSKPVSDSAETLLLLIKERGVGKENLFASPGTGSHSTVLSSRSNSYCKSSSPSLDSQKVKLNQSENGFTGIGYVFRPPTHFMDET